MFTRNKNYQNRTSLNSLEPRPQGGYIPSPKQPPYTGGYHNPYQPYNQSRSNLIDNDYNYNSQYFNQGAIGYTQKPYLPSQNYNPEEIKARIENLKNYNKPLPQETQKSQYQEPEPIPIPVKINSSKVLEGKNNRAQINPSSFNNRSEFTESKIQRTEINPFDNNFKSKNQNISPINGYSASSIVPSSQIKKLLSYKEQELEDVEAEKEQEIYKKIYKDDYKQQVKSGKLKSANLIKRRQSKEKVQRLLARKKESRWQKILINSFAIFLFVTSSVSALFVWNQYNLTMSGGQVAGASDQKYSNFEEYEKWIKEKAGEYLKPEEDADGDGLTNYEEFLIGSNPTSKNTCSEEKNDMENLLSLIHPATCKPIDLENQEELELFSKIINFEMVKENFLTDENQTQEGKENQENNTISQNYLLEVFQVSSFQELSSLNSTEIEQTRLTLDKKKEYLRLVQKIDEYIKRYRSYDIHDRNYPEPVHPAIYLQVSLEYNVPLRYVLAVARKESRFGTDRYTASGQLTRPGRFQNIYSIGLDDSGNNHLYETWEDGVRGFGRWYQSFEQRGVDDCRKWRIYNPNGDYCQVIENLANQIQIFLDSE